jgi:hypothetical protein
VVSAGLPHGQVLLLREAAQRLIDLELLGGRIHTRARQLLEASAKEPVAEMGGIDVLQVLRDASKTNAELAKWFTDNPNPKVAGVSKALTLGPELGCAPMESIEEQELRLDTELFYYVAHRFCACLGLLPHLVGFRCKEVAIIRNQLLEHPEGASSGVLLPAFGYRSDVGPVIKGMRYAHQAEIHPDAGFVPNCRILLESTTRALEGATDRVAAGHV